VKTFDLAWKFLEVYHRAVSGAWVSRGSNGNIPSRSAAVSFSLTSFCAGSIVHYSLYSTRSSTVCFQNWNLCEQNCDVRFFSLCHICDNYYRHVGFYRHCFSFIVCCFVMCERLTEHMHAQELVVTWFWRLVAGLSLRRPAFVPVSVHVEFVVDRVALGQVFLRVIRFPLSMSFHRGSPYSCHQGDKQ
jgi:hypothetical protein